MRLNATSRIVAAVVLLSALCWGLTGEVSPFAQPSSDARLLAIATALDANGNDILNDDEIREAVRLWITGEAVPGTDMTIGDDLIRELIRLWITGEAIGATPEPQPTGPAPEPDGGVSPFPPAQMRDDRPEGPDNQGDLGPPVVVIGDIPGEDTGTEAQEQGIVPLGHVIQGKYTIAYQGAYIQDEDGDAGASSEFYVIMTMAQQQSENKDDVAVWTVRVGPGGYLNDSDSGEAFSDHIVLRPGTTLDYPLIITTQVMENDLGSAQQVAEGINKSIEGLKKGVNLAKPLVELIGGSAGTLAVTIANAIVEALGTILDIICDIAGCEDDVVGPPQTIKITKDLAHQHTGAQKWKGLTYDFWTHHCAPSPQNCDSGKEGSVYVMYDIQPTVGLNNPPQVKILEPKDGSSFELSGLNIVTFKASVEDVEEGDCPLCNIQWSSDKEGPMGEGKVLEHIFTKSGPQTITLTVKDSGGATSKASIQVTVGGNTPPSVTIEKPTQNQSLFKDIPYVFESSSWDTESFSPLPCSSLTWTSSNVGDASFPVTGCQPQVTFTTTGTRTITLTGKDSQGASGTDTVTINVVNPPDSGPPVVTILNPENDTLLNPNNPITLKGTATDPDGKSISYKWVLKKSPAGTLLAGGKDEITLATGTIQSGQQFTLPGWKPSDHVPFSCGGNRVRIYLYATDPDNNTGSAFVEVGVNYPPC